MHITEGEHIFSPQLRDPSTARPAADHSSYIYTRLPLLEAGNKGHYFPLRQRLNAYASNLASQIDAGTFTLPLHHQHARALTPEQLAHRHCEDDR